MNEREFTGEELRAWIDTFQRLPKAAKFVDNKRAWSHDLRTVLVAANQGDADAIVCAEAWQAELVKHRLKGYT